MRLEPCIACVGASNGIAEKILEVKFEGVLLTALVVFMIEQGT